MTCADDAKALLPFYAAGTLSDDGMCAVEAHLSQCAECQSELALWREIGGAVVLEARSLPEPSPTVLSRVLAQTRQRQVSLWEQAWQLLCSQAPLVRREIWLTSALVMGLGYVIALLSGNAAGVVEAIAPLVAVAGVAMIYGPENDPGLELALATPTSPRQVLLARLVLVFSYDLALSLVATGGLLMLVPVDLLGGVIVNWLGPMALLSSLALLLSLCLGTGNAVAISFVLWLSRFVVKDLIQPPFPGGVDAGSAWLAVTYEGLWTNTALLAALAAVLVLASIWVVGRQESYLTQRPQLSQ